MISAHRHGAVVHLHTEGNDDADRRDMAAILAAYFEAEQARVFRRVLWKRLGAVAIIALVFEAMTRLMSTTVLVGFLAFVCGTGLIGAMVNWRAHRRLWRLVDEHSDTEHLPGDAAQHTARIIDTHQRPAARSGCPTETENARNRPALGGPPASRSG